MKNISLFFVLTCSFFLFSCGPNLKEENKKTREQLIEVHDEVMPLMGKLKSLEKQILQKAEELEMTNELDSLKATELKTLALELDMAYEGMFIWMRQYDVEDGQKSPEEVKVYLEEQMGLVQKVNSDIKDAISKADSLVKN
jgi:hypothetical protein